MEQDEGKVVKVVRVWAKEGFPVETCPRQGMITVLYSNGNEEHIGEHPSSWRS